MPDIEFIEGEIECMRCQVLRQRNEILQLQRAGISTTVIAAIGSIRQRPCAPVRLSPRNRYPGLDCLG
jgi:hypothetical protein